MAEEGFIFPRGFASKFYAYRLGNQAIPSGVNTLAQLNAEMFDILGEFDAVATFQFVPLQTGYYHFKGQGSFGTLPLGTVTWVRMDRSGATVAEDLRVHDGANPFRMQVVWFGYMDLAERMELFVYQNSGVVQNLLTGWHVTHLHGFRVA